MLALVATSSGGQAQVMNESACRLQFLTNVQSPLAVNFINQACNFLSTQSSTMELNRRERVYNECLLRSLSGALSDPAANSIAQACRDQSQRL
jgi:hypothetical protein